MANIKITDLTAYGDPASTDVLPIVDVGADVTKKVSIADLLKNAGSGTDDLPGIAFDGDSNTGIYRPGADQLAISTNGTGRLFVDANGKVGFNKSNPLDPIDVAGGIRTTGATSNANVTGGLIDWNNGTRIFAYATGGAPIQFYTNASGGNVSERLRITSAGNVGIGVTAPEDKLEIGGAGASIILASPDGTRYRLTVANGGTLSITAV